MFLGRISAYKGLGLLLEVLLGLPSDKVELDNSKRNVREFSKMYFSMNGNVEKFIEEIKKIKQSSSVNKHKKQIFLSRLDSRYIPNYLTKRIREIKIKYFLK
jgi:hypothetical protein